MTQDMQVFGRMASRRRFILVLGLGGGMSLISACQSASTPTAPAVPVATAAAPPTPAASTASTVVAPTVGAAAPAATAVAPVPGASITYAISGDPDTLDPGNEGPSQTKQIMATLFDGLTSLGADMVVRPGLATDWSPSADGLKWTFRLRTGAVFHDGQPVDAQAVKFSIERVLDAQNNLKGRRFVVPVVKSVQVIDDATAELTLVQPFAPLPFLASQMAMSIVSPTAARQAGQDFGRQPVGSGPFVFKQWDSGQRVIVERNPHYWGSPAKPQQVTFLTVPQDATRVALLETGQADLAQYIPPADSKRLAGSSQIQLIQTDSLELRMIRFNMLDDRFKDLRVRTALNYAVNVPEIIDTVLEGLATSTGGPQPKPVPGELESNKYHYDPTTAKSLLADAGFANGFKTSLSFNPATASGLAETVQALQAQWLAVGVDVALNQLDADAYARFNALPPEQEQQKQLMVHSTTYRYADSSFLLPSFHSSQWPPNGSNYGFYKNNQVDALLDQGQGESDQTKRTAIYQQAQQLIVDDAPIVFLFSPRYLYASRGLKGVQLPPNEMISFTDIAKG